MTEQVDPVVVIVTYQSAMVIRGCLAPLRDKQVVVVDNASSDGTADLIANEFAWVSLVRLPENRGFAAGVNVGAATAPGRDLLLLNPDVEASGESVDALAGALA